MNPTSPESTAPLFPRGMIVDRSAQDADQMKELAAFWRIEQEQLEPGPYYGSILAFHTSRLQLATTYRSRSTRVRGRVPEGAVAFGVVPRAKHAVLYNCRPLGRREIAVCRAGDEFSFQTKEDTRDVTVAVSLEMLQEYAAANWREPWEARCHRERLAVSNATSAEEIGERLAALIYTTLKRPKRILNEAFSRVLEITILDQLFGQIAPVPPTPPRSRRMEYAMGAKELIRETAGAPPRMQDLCRHLGCSIRTLETGFREAYGVSLKSQVQIMRLNGARRDLRAAKGKDDLVKAIALKWGFMHLGRFSVTYRQWFGESPRETLGR